MQKGMMVSELTVLQSGSSISGLEQQVFSIREPSHEILVKALCSIPVLPDLSALTEQRESSAYCENSKVGDSDHIMFLAKGMALRGRSEGYLSACVRERIIPHSEIELFYNAQVGAFIHGVHDSLVRLAHHSTPEVRKIITYGFLNNWNIHRIHADLEPFTFMEFMPILNEQLRKGYKISDGHISLTVARDTKLKFNGNSLDLYIGNSSTGSDRINSENTYRLQEWFSHLKAESKNGQKALPL